MDATLALPGVGGLSVNTLHQEFWALTQAERLRLVEVVLDQVRGRVPVVVGCSDPAPDNVLMYAHHARAHGADLVMVWPPYYGPRSAQGVRHFYEWLAPRVGIGMVIYSTTLAELGFYLTPDQAQALLPLREICALQSTTLNFASHAAMDTANTSGRARGERRKVRRRMASSVRSRIACLGGFTTDRRHSRL